MPEPTAAQTVQGHNTDDRNLRDGVEQDCFDSFERFRDLVEGIAAVVWEADPDRSLYAYVSRHAERLLGFPVAMWTTQPHFWVERIHHNDRARTVLSGRRAATEGRDHELEYRILGDDGRVIWVRDIVQVLRSRDGRPMMLRGVMTDVTARKRAEEALTVRARQQAAVAEMSHRAITHVECGALLADTAELVAVALGVPMVEVHRATRSGALEVVASAGMDGGVGSRPVRLAPAAEPDQASWAWREDQAVIADDLSTDVRFSPDPFLLALGAKSGITVVIPGNKRPFGLLSAYAKHRRSFASHDLHFLQAIGHMVAAALERLQASEELARSERRFNLLAATAPVGILQTDATGRCTYVNERWRELVGFTPAASRRLDWLRAVHPQDRRRVRTAWGRAVRLGAPFAVECRLTGPDGAVLWGLLQAQPERRPDGAVVGWVGTVTDISELKRAEEALKESQRKISSLMADLPGMAYRCRNDSTWTMELVSDGCRELTGYEPADIVDNGRLSFSDLILPEDQAMVWSEVQTAVQARSPYRLSYRIRHRDGSARWVWEQGRAVYGSDESVLALEGFITDISERKTLEEQLRQSQKLEAVGRLAGGIAHDFNNLLTAILGFAVLVMGQLGEEHPLWRRVAEIKKAAERAASLTSQLLAFGRSQILQPRVLDIYAVVSDMDQMLRRLIGEDVDLVTVRGPVPGRVRADRGQLEQVVVNLAINARDSMPGGGRLEIEVSVRDVAPGSREHQGGLPAGSWVVLSVRDSGGGMDQDTQNRIFEPFFTTKEKSKGTGLGLATVYGIVKQSGGEIRVESAPGEGSRFDVLLPRVDDEVEPARRRQEDEAERGTETVLLVEDEDMVRELAWRALEMHGYRVMETGRPEEALAILRDFEGTIDIMVTDVVMPVMSGGALAQHASMLRPTMRVLFMSGYTDDAIVHHGINDRRHAFLQKPFTPSDLARMVRSVLDE
ncbi:MAG: hypothetical protein AMXMBFR64_47210 [Myxococcales bacterium]